ncbi:nucleoside-diphosphate sugar epimerase [Mucor ambiguus]|uniref:Nucleoside-diphosphate sugar epimerase n=1 Tax=Mucor ambiguus TaxID=91626 RepID=A0A0C9MRV0_9FUNG|nr:nucleoside-diphosphate sugar epimerase [Mucor ambiguus]
MTTTATSTERIFIIGPTGSIGSKTVQDLLANQVPVTLYARNPSKVTAMFPQANSELLKVVQGDFEDLSPIKEAVKGHTRLYLIASDLSTYAQVKKTIATYAYAAGVKQIVDISSSYIDHGWRTTAIGQMSYIAESGVFNIPDRGYLVTLRPTRFMGNMLGQMSRYVNQGIFNNVPKDFAQGWASNNDIGALAAVILQEDIHKHQDAVYNMTSDVCTPAQFTAILSKIVGKDLPYHQITDVQMYNALMQAKIFPHPVAIEFIDYRDEKSTHVTPCIEIMLGRKPETLEEFLNANKDKIMQHVNH